MTYHKLGVSTLCQFWRKEVQFQKDVLTVHAGFINILVASRCVCVRWSFDRVGLTLHGVSANTSPMYVHVMMHRWCSSEEEKKTNDAWLMCFTLHVWFPCFHCRLGAKDSPMGKLGTVLRSTFQSVRQSSGVCRRHIVRITMVDGERQLQRCKCKCDPVVAIGRLPRNSQCRRMKEVEKNQCRVPEPVPGTA